MMLVTAPDSAGHRYRALDSQQFRTPAIGRLLSSSYAMVLAGGRGTRLQGLTAWRAKPALPFGGKHRIVDFTLSNCVNSGIRRVGVATQYKAHSLIQHLQRGWGFLDSSMREFVDVLPAQQRGSTIAGTPGRPTPYIRTWIFFELNPPRIRTGAGRRSCLQDGLRSHAWRARGARRRWSPSPASTCRFIGRIFVRRDASRRKRKGAGFRREAFRTSAAAKRPCSRALYQYGHLHLQC